MKIELNYFVLVCVCVCACVSLSLCVSLCVCVLENGGREMINATVSTSSAVLTGQTVPNLIRFDWIVLDIYAATQ